MKNEFRKMKEQAESLYNEIGWKCKYDDPEKKVDYLHLKIDVMEVQIRNIEAMLLLLFEKEVKE